MHTNAILDHDSSGSAVGYPVRVPAAARRARGIASPGRAPAWAPAAGAARPPARWPRCATCVETGLESFFFLSCSSVFDAGPH